jgi:tRNA threonylcarbamoyladenosine biosynthesis protein TsaB
MECLMRLLAIESSTPSASVAVIEWGGGSDGAPANERMWTIRLESGRPQTETLLEAVDQLLSECGCGIRDLDGFAAAVGPGAFIGVRVGLATVKGLAMGAGRPVVPVSTLEALAFRALEPEMFDAASVGFSSKAMEPLTICPMIDARRGEVYAAGYRLDRDRNVVVLEGEEMLISPEAMLERLSGPVLFLGDGARLHRSLIVRQLELRALFPSLNGADAMEPSAAAVARLAVHGWKEGHAIDPGELTAVYLRPAVEQPAEAQAE